MKALFFYTVLFAIYFVATQAYGPLFKVFPQSTPLYRGRADPIISPGGFSQHTHRVFGASGFSLGIAGRSAVDTYNDMIASTCTTASITIDKSAYWIPDLYYQWPNGTFSIVPVGGITVYYFGRAGSGDQVNPDFKAFPAGFRMIAGNAFRRNYTGSIPDQGISYACLSVPGSAETHGFPTATLKCVNGLRAQVFFPQCWDGVNIDSPNHQDHVHYPDQYNTGNCPLSHPVRIPALFYEVLYSVDQSSFPHGNGVQPFVWAMGDPTGYGLHGDFLNGWDVDILHAAMHDPSCLSTITNEGNNPEKCLPLKPYVKSSNPDQSCLLDRPILNYEDIGLNHWISHLPGNNIVDAGPGQPTPLFGSYAQTIAPNVQRVFLKSVRTGLFVSCKTNYGPGSILTANVDQSQLSYPQVFDIVPLGNNNFGIATESSTHWVSSNNGGNSPVTGDRNGPSDWEYWHIVYYGGTGPTQAGTLGSLLAMSNNRFVTVQSNGQLYATATTATPNEQFLIIDANAGVPDTRNVIPTAGPTQAPTPVPTPGPTARPPTNAPGSIPALGYLQSKATGKYVTVLPPASQQLVATETSTATANVFVFSAIPGGYSMKQRQTNQFVSADNGGDAPLVANRNGPGGWETFVVSQPSSGYFAFNAVNQKYVAVQPAAGNNLLANVAVPYGTAIPDSALFSVVVPTPLTTLTSVDIVTATQVKLYSQFGMAYIIVDGYGTLLAGGDSAAGSVTFNVAKVAGGYTLQNNANAKYTTADGGGSGPLIANRGSASGWETFVFIAQPGGTYAIQATANNQLVAVQPATQLIASVANSGTVPASALFYVVAP